MPLETSVSLKASVCAAKAAASSPTPPPEAGGAQALPDLSPSSSNSRAASLDFKGEVPAGSPPEGMRGPGAKPATLPTQGSRRGTRPSRLRGMEEGVLQC